METSQNHKILTVKSCDETSKSQADLVAEIDGLKQRMATMEKMIQGASPDQNNLTGDNLSCSSVKDIPGRWHSE